MRATDGTAVLGLDHRPGLWSAAAAREALTDLFPAADTLVANIDEAKRVLKQTGEGPEVAHGVANEWDFETVVVTVGERGALVYHDATIHERDAVETEAVDVAGQHNAFVGAFLGRRLAGGDVGDALTHGVAAAALARTIHGPVPAITADEVESVAEEIDAGSPGGAGGRRSHR
jgi:2-dehydro-3-deoxygluconokinase